MSAGKGDRPRTVDAEIYGANYDEIFRKAKDLEEITPTPCDGCATLCDKCNTNHGRAIRNK
jgi:hypothetical protein